MNRRFIFSYVDASGATRGANVVAASREIAEAQLTGAREGTVELVGEVSLADERPRGPRRGMKSMRVS